MALKKSQLYSSLWSSCDELRGGMDASQYKDYVLTLLFMKYVSDRYAGKPGQVIVVPEGGSFADMVELKGNKQIGEKIDIIIGKTAAPSTRSVSRSLANTGADCAWRHARCQWQFPESERGIRWLPETREP